MSKESKFWDSFDKELLKKYLDAKKKYRISQQIKYN